MWRNIVDWVKKPISSDTNPSPISSPPPITPDLPSMESASPPAVSEEYKFVAAKPFQKDGKNPQGALQQSQEKKKDNSYYYAHTRHMEIPSHAIVLEGPGIITGGLPQLIKPSKSSDCSTECSAEKPAAIPAEAVFKSAEKSADVSVPAGPIYLPIQKFAWSDEGSKVSIYVFREAFPAGHNLMGENVSVEFGESNFDCRVSFGDETSTKSFYRLRLDPIFDEIDIKKSYFRVSASKISIQLVKINSQSTWTSLQRK